MRYTKVFTKAGTIAVSAALAASLAVGTAPIALAQTAQSVSITRSADEAKADAYDVEAIATLVKQYKDAGGTDASAKALETYLNGKAVASDDFALIDAKELTNQDKVLAKEIKDKQDAQKAAEEAAAKADANAGSSDSGASANTPAKEDPAPAEPAQQPASDPSADQPAAAETSSAPEAQQPASVTDQPTDATTDGTLSSESPSQSSETYVPGSITSNPTTQEFISSIAEQARTVGQQHDLYASVMIAQAVLESGSGSSGLSRAPYFNLFGIKGSYQGQSVTMSTVEDDGNGNHYSVDAAFRRYPSTQESLEDYADLLTNVMGTYYAPVRKSNAPTYVDACNYLQGHYATDTSYSAKLQDIISTYHLTDYDNPADAAAIAAAEQAAAEAANGEDRGDDAMDQAIFEDAALMANNGEDSDGADSADEDGAGAGDGNPWGAVVPGAAAIALATAANRRLGPFRRDPAMDMAKTLPLPSEADMAAHSMVASYETLPDADTAHAPEAAAE